MKGFQFSKITALLICQAIILLGTAAGFSFRKQTINLSGISRRQQELHRHNKQHGYAQSHTTTPLILFQSSSNGSDDEASSSDTAFFAKQKEVQEVTLSVSQDNSNKLRTAASLFDYDSAYVVFASAIIGVLSGFAVAIFKLSIEAVREATYGSAFSEKFVWWLIPAAVGGLGVSLLAMTGDFAPGLRGTANEVDALSLNVQEDLRFKDALRFLRKPLAAILTLGSGCSLGPEGPSVEVGMTMSRLCMPPSLQRSDLLAEVDAAARLRRNRLLLSAGAAAGVAAGFNAPLAGVFFALEILQQNLPPLTISGASGPLANSIGNQRDQISWQQQVQQDYLASGTGSITSILIASVLSALVSQVYLGEELALSVPSYQLNTPLVELPLVSRLLMHYISLCESQGLVESHSLITFGFTNLFCPHFLTVPIVGSCFRCGCWFLLCLGPTFQTRI